MGQALERLADVTGWTWDIDDGDLVHVMKAGTDSQKRHLAKRKKLSTGTG